MRRFAVVSALTAGVLVASGLAAQGAVLKGGGSLPGCKGTSKGGQWASMGHDLSNTRAQIDEKKIGPEQAPDIESKWTFSSSSQVGENTGPGGDFQSTVNVADGCVYGATSAGGIF